MSVVRIWKKRPWGAAAAIVLALAGVGYAAVSFVPTNYTFPEGGWPSNHFTTFVNINTTPVGGGGFGDTILSIEEGRDDRGPYCAILVLFGPNNPHAAPASACAVPGVTVALPDYLTTEDMLNPCAILPTATGARRFVYRPTVDPANPGWGQTATAAQIEAAQAACRHVAEAFCKYDASQRAGVFSGYTRGTPGLPIIQLEIDIDPNRPTFYEFYKFRIPSHN